MRRSLLLIALLSSSLVPCVAATDGAPAGWLLAGDHPQNYNTGADSNGTAFLASKTDGTGAGFGTLMQAIKADDYAGKRVRFKATVRSENLTQWAGLWMRIDGGKKTLAFDNMSGRPIKGTTGWTTYEVVLNVPINATGIYFGALVSSNGEIWLRGVQLEAIDSGAPVTGVPMAPGRTRPVNLDFRQ